VLQEIQEWERNKSSRLCHICSILLLKRVLVEKTSVKMLSSSLSILNKFRLFMSILQKTSICYAPLTNYLPESCPIPLLNLLLKLLAPLRCQQLQQSIPSSNRRGQLAVLIKGYQYKDSSYSASEKTHI